MSLNSKEIFSRLLDLYNVDKLNELSLLLGFKKNWGASTRSRGGIPLEACVITAEKFNISLDYLLLGSGKNDSVEHKITKMKESVTDGVFEAIQTGVITPEKDVSISFITEIIASKLDYIYEYNTNEARIMHEKFIKEFKI